MLIKTLKSAARSLFAAPARDAVEYPLEIEEKLNRAHTRAPVDRHLRILFENVAILLNFQQSFLDKLLMHWTFSSSVIIKGNIPSAK